MGLEDKQLFFYEPFDTPRGNLDADSSTHLFDSVVPANWNGTDRTVSNSNILLDEAREIAESVQRGSAILRSAQRMGNSSVLLSVENFYPPSSILHVDLLGFSTVKNQRTAGEFLSELGTHVSDFTKRSPISNQPLHDLQTILEASNSECLLVIEEGGGMAELQKREEALKYISSAMRLSHIHTLLQLPKSQEQEEKLYAKYFRDIPTHFLRVLTLEETAMLIKGVTRSRKITATAQFSDQAIGEIYRIAGGRPWEISLLTYELLEGGNSQKASKVTGKVYHASDAADLISRSLFDLYNSTQLKEVIKHYMRTYHFHLTSDEIDVMYEIVFKGGMKLPTRNNKIRKALQSLANIRWVIQDPTDPSRAVINGELLRKTLDEQPDLLPAEE